jgi:hypothetical protein
MHLNSLYDGQKLEFKPQRQRRVKVILKECYVSCFFIHLFIEVFKLACSQGIVTKNARVGEEDVEHIITMQKVKGEEDANTCHVASECNGICYLYL